MPAALYPKNIKLGYLSRGGIRTLVADNEIKAALLCFKCEQRFSQRGESEVLGQIAGKIANKPSPLLAKLGPLTVREEDETLRSYCGAEAGLVRILCPEHRVALDVFVAGFRWGEHKTLASRAIRRASPAVLSR
jgi:hypothetical protein